MKKYVWVVALVLISTFATAAAADVTSPTRQDQAFVPQAWPSRRPSRQNPRPASPRRSRPR